MIRLVIGKVRGYYIPSLTIPNTKARDGNYQTFGKYAVKA